MGDYPNFGADGPGNSDDRPDPHMRMRGMSDGNKASPRDKSPIETQLDNLAQELNYLSTALDQHFMKLRPVLAPGSEREKEMRDDSPEMSDVAQAVANCTDHVQSLRSAVEHHTRRLEC